MLCSKCHENVPQGKEIQIEGTIICKECDLVIEQTKKEKAIARCWNCNEFILKGDLIHEISKNNSKNWINWLFFDLENYEKMPQCDDCYQEWRNKVKKGKNWLEAKGWIIFLCWGGFLYSVTSLFFSERFKKLNNETPEATVFFILLFIITFLLGPILSINRYEFRKKSKSKKK